MSSNDGKHGMATKRPNILYIMSDDHASNAIGSYGSRLAGLNPTPTIDSLAANGMRFDKVFCTNSICTPSRATIMSGQYSQTNEVLDLTHTLIPERHYLAQEMNKAGYDTAMIGKWHLYAEPVDFGLAPDPRLRTGRAHCRKGRAARCERSRFSDPGAARRRDDGAYGRKPACIRPTPLPTSAWSGSNMAVTRANPSF